MTLQAPYKILFKPLVKKDYIKMSNLSNSFLLLELQPWLPCQRKGKGKPFTGTAFNVEFL